MKYPLGFPQVFVTVHDADVNGPLPRLKAPRKGGYPFPEVMELRCIDNDRVPLQLGTRIKVDTNTFKAADGALWRTHYPRARTTGFEGQGDVTITCMDPDSARPEMEEVTHYIGRVLTAMYLCRKDRPDHWERLTDHYMNISSALYSLGYLVKPTNRTVALPDGTKQVFPTLFDVSLVARRLATA